MLLDRDLRGAPLRRREVMLWAVINPEDGFTAAEVTPASVGVQVRSEDLTTDFGTQTATFSTEVSAALTTRLGYTVRAWVAQLPAITYGGAARVAVTSIVTVGSTAYPSTEIVAVVGP
jgi:uncharacterized protein YaiE (UPF0345 family)